MISTNRHERHRPTAMSGRATALSAVTTSILTLSGHARQVIGKHISLWLHSADPLEYLHGRIDHAQVGKFGAMPRRVAEVGMLTRQRQRRRTKSAGEAIAR